MYRIMIALVGLALVPACGAVDETSTAEQESEEHPPIDGEQATAELIGSAVEDLGGTCAEPDDCEGMEQIGEVQQATAQGDACVFACAVSYAALCQRVRTLCAVATVVTIGRAIVPCSAAIGVVCVGGAGLIAICARRCPP